MVARIPSDSPHESSLSSRRPSVGDGNDNEKEHDYQMYAQKLNNNAAMCIEVGYYDKATHSLQRALNFYQKQSDKDMVKMCPCDHCEDDGNIDFSADFRARAPRRLSMTSIDSDEGDEDEDEYICKPKKSISKEDIKFLTKSISNPKLEKVMSEERRRLREGGEKNANWSIKDDFCEQEIQMDENSEELIYRRPIRVERVGQPMGGSLFLIITFNLALTHHLEVAMANSKKRLDANSAKKALLFYELTSTHESRQLSDSVSRWDSLSSIRFNTILRSNLTQLLQYLPKASIVSARRLSSSVADSINKETERLSEGSMSVRSRHSRSPSRWSIDGDDSSDESWISKRSSSRRGSKRGSIGSIGGGSLGGGSLHGGSNHDSPAGRKLSLGRGTPSSIRLQNALGDMAPTPCSRRNSAR